MNRYFLKYNKRNIYYTFKRIQRYIPNIFSQIKQHHYLFILSPPFCGSTLLNELISTSSNISCNNDLGTREGQTLPEVRKILFDKKRWCKEKYIPWYKVKDIWSKYWDLSKPILMDKSTTNIIRVNDIKKVFKPISFIAIVRNPYAQCEGIIRRNNQSAEYAAKFAIKCLKYQKKNIENENNLLFFSYEEMCENTHQVVSKIQEFIPSTSDIKLKKKYNAHNFKSDKRMTINNLNQEKIKKLDKEQIKVINSYFIKEKELLEYFNYSII
tara:strand:+ start:13 stop:819 length:807 start_codon:yes stop_codon:yes gene_type:complete